MNKYDYYEAVLTDVKDWMAYEVEYIKEAGCADREDLEEWLHDTLWTTDGVTGNGSGSYTFNTWTAEENLCHNLDLLGEALAEFGCNISYLEEKGAEACDVTIRCYLLSGAISEALDELEEAGELGKYLTGEEEEEKE